MDYKVLARSWRPRSFAEVVGQEATLKALQQSLLSQQLHHAYLFTGTRGVGKTSIARILAKSINCATGIVAEPCGSCDICVAIDNGACVDVIEVDAASRTKVEDTRELLDNVPYAPVHARFKVYIIDEVHMLSKHSFNALLKTLEEPPEHVKFILATTDPQKLPDTILSRCLQFHLRSLTSGQVAQHLQHILQQEKINFDSEALQAIGEAANGSMRDALSLLEQVIAFGERNVTLQAAQAILGTALQAQTLDLLRHIVDGDVKLALATVHELSAHNADFNVVLKELQTLIYQLAVAHLVPDDTTKDLLELGQRIEAAEIQLLYQITLLGVRDLPYAPNMRIGFEMIVLRMLSFVPELGSVTEPAVTETKKPTTVAATAVNTAPKANIKSSVTHKAAAPVKSPATTQVVTKAAPVAKPPAKHTLNSASDWAKIVMHLNLQGISKMIAEHCTVNSLQDHEVILTLDETQKPLLSAKHTERIESALQSYLGKKIQVIVKVGTLNTVAPAQARQDKAEQSIETDANIKKIMQTFDAKISNITAREE